MITYFDTNVLIAACRADHVHHEASYTALSHARPGEAACSLHSLAEMYAVTTGMPARARLSPAEASIFLNQIRNHCTLVSLTEAEYSATIEDLALRQLTGGLVYDALLLACARKCEADRILTHNVRHFQRIAPDLADRIVAP